MEQLVKVAKNRYRKLNIVLIILWSLCTSKKPV